MFLYLKSQEQAPEPGAGGRRCASEGSALVFLLDHGAVRVDFPTPEEARGALEALMVELIFKRG